MPHSFRFFVVVVASVACGASCTTFNNARPLDPGQHAAMATLGGPLTNVPGVGTIPLPNVTLEGRSGLKPLFGSHLDVNYGLHVLPAVFGVYGGHVGAAAQVVDEDGWIPALTVGQRFFFFTNVLDPRKGRKDGFLMSQTDLTASYRFFDSQLLYGGLTMYLPLDAGARVPRFAPVLGVEAHLPKDWGTQWLALQLETRWLSPDVDQRFAVVDWVSPGDRGAIAVNLGVAVRWSDFFCDCEEPKHEVQQ